MRSTKRAVYSGLAALGIVLGAAGLANAATGNGSGSSNTAAVVHPSSATDTSVDAPDQGDEAPAYTSSVTTADAVEATSETDESATLAPLATVTSDQASAAAVAAQPGTVVKVELENENGNVVYGVEIDTGNGRVDVKVDAGNGTVLATQADGHDGEQAD